jgi:site-specific DNA-methyltransferase (adenine-specific)
MGSEVLFPRSTALVIRPQQISEPACKLIVGDSAVKLKELAADSIDLTVTSPPYDGLRTYGTVRPEAINQKVIHNRQRPANRAFNYIFDFETIARELYRVTKPGGVVVWIVADQTRNDSESGTSFRQALFFMELGFNLYDTMIFASEKPPSTHRRYEQKFEFMFVFSKGRPNTFNPIMIPCTNAGQTPKRRTVRNTDGQLGGFRQPKPVKAMKIKGNIWTYDTGARAGEDKIAHLHPAIFPEKLAEDHILSWSNVGDVVLDPFLGSGTTGKMAIKNGRQFIGIDVSAEYVELARKRIGQPASIVTACPSEGEPTPKSAPQPPVRKLRLIHHIVINEHFFPKIAQVSARSFGDYT